MGDRPDHGAAPAAPSALVGAARPADAADILALGRATLDTLTRVLRHAPEVRGSRLLTRWPLEPEDILFELEPTSSDTAIPTLADRLGVTLGQVRSTALRLQRMSLVRVTGDAVTLTSTGRQKLARLDHARAAALRRIADGLVLPLTEAEARLVIRLLHVVLERAEAVAEEQFGGSEPPG